MKRSALRIIGLLMFLFVTAGLGSSESFAANAEQPKVYIVQSYESDNVCGRPQEEGIVEILEKEYGERLVIRTHYMDTKTVNSAKEAMQADAAKVLQEIEVFGPDIVFTVDDNAFREVGLKLVGRSFPVVFTGMNAQPEVYNAKIPFLDSNGIPNANITGVYEKLHVQTSLNVVKGILPDLKKVVALLDNTTTGYAVEAQLQKELENNTTGVAMLFVMWVRCRS